MTETYRVEAHCQEDRGINAVNISNRVILGKVKELIMIVNKKYIRDLREKSFLNISEDMEKVILEKFGKDPGADENGFVYEYTDQDICEQIRKMLHAK